MIAVVFSLLFLHWEFQKTLERETRQCQALVIWTDCDREGENIGFEIIHVCRAGKCCGFRVPVVWDHRSRWFPCMDGPWLSSSPESLPRPLDPSVLPSCVPWSKLINSQEPQLSGKSGQSDTQRIILECCVCLLYSLYSAGMLTHTC